LPFAAVVAVICAAITFRIARSPFGRALKAMRENEAAAAAIGKNIVYMKVVVFAIAAGLAAVAGSLLARYISFVGTESFTIEETIYILAMVILGGTGNLWGSILGAVILVFLPEALKFVDMSPDVADKMRQVIYGLILIGILMLRPHGILGEHRTAPRLARSGRADAHAEEQLGQGTDAAPGAVTIRARGFAKNFGGI